MIIGIPLAKVRAENAKYAFTQESLTIEATNKTTSKNNEMTVYFDVTNNTDVEIKYFSVEITFYKKNTTPQTCSATFSFRDVLSPDDTTSKSIKFSNLHNAYQSSPLTDFTLSFKIQSITCPERGTVYLDLEE